MASFKGHAEYSVDSKGRIASPAKMRSAVRPEANQTFVVTRGLEECAVLYPLDVWERREKRMAELNTYRKKPRAYVRVAMMWAEEVTLDAQGRISIPRPLIEFADLDGTAVILGSIDHIEIWNPERFDAYLESEVGDFETLSEEVMGTD